MQLHVDVGGSCIGMTLSTCGITSEDQWMGSDMM